MRIDNEFMLKQFSLKDEILYYNFCKDISLAGPEYKVKDVHYFISNKSDPLSDYVAIKIYDDEDGFILIYAYTSDIELLNETLSYILGISKEVKEIELRTPFPEIYKYSCFTDNFNIINTKDSINPVYYIHTQNELNRIPIDDDIQINLVTEEDKAEVAQEEKVGHLDPEYFGEGIFFVFSFYKDTKVFILRVRGKIVGYLRAENGFSNIYDIGWLYVLPEYRGHRYAVHMTLYFSDYCFENGFIPQYGYAINTESVSVAKKSGYKCNQQIMYAKNLSLCTK